MNHIDISIIIQKELDACNEKIKKYDKKYNPEKKEQIELLIQYLQEHLDNDDDSEHEISNETLYEPMEFNKKLLLDDIQTLKNYICHFE